MLFDEMKKRLLLFLKDDFAGKDITSNATPEKKAIAVIRANEPCVLAGAEEALFLFRFAGLSAKAFKKDGAQVGQGQKVLEIRGSNRGILRVERAALNVLGRMSGVATKCAEAQKLAGRKTTVALTRKTVPGFNLFDKKAAVVGGIWPHRLTLADAVLVKENHLVFFGSVREAVAAGLEAAKKSKKAKFVEVEVQTISQAKEAALAAPDMVMLDNFGPMEAKKAVAAIRKENPKIKIEISGGINLKNLKAYASLRPDYVSMGALTRDAKMMDFSLDIFPQKARACLI